MTSIHYKILFDGQIQEGQDPARVKQNLMTLFKLSESAASKLFSGSKVVIKKDLDEPAARKYQMAFEKAGAICIVEKLVLESETVSQEESTGTGPATLGNITIAKAGTVILEHENPQEPAIDISSLSMAEAGEIIMTHPEIQPPTIDAAAYEVEPVGVDLDTTPPAPQANIQTDHLSVSPSGEVLTEAEPQKKPEIDTTHLSLEK